MAEKADIVDQSLTKTPTELPPEAGRAQDRDIAGHTSKIETALGHLANHIAELQTEQRALKPKLDHVTKELAVLGFKAGEPVEPGRLPINADFIEKLDAAFKDGGMNVKSLQKALVIFDYAEMTRKRKALQAAKVTIETENYRGTNATWVELNPEFIDAKDDEEGKHAASATE